MSFSTQTHEEEEQTRCYNLVPSLIRKARAHCRVFSCLKSPSYLSSDDEEEEDSLLESDLDCKHVIILEIRNRATKAKQRPNYLCFADSLHWVLSPTSGEQFIAPKEERKDGEVLKDEGDHKEEGSEAFYSVKSCFSRCCSSERDEEVMVVDYLKDCHARSTWEELCHLEGWPFGLWRRALMLPPLPNSPVDSWNWRKMNLGKV